MSYEHEFKRFSSMTLSKCYTRLDRITKSDKLREFISMAGEFKYWDLQEKAKAKLNVLLGKPAETPRMVDNLLKEKKKRQLTEAAIEGRVVSCAVCAKKIIIRNGQPLCASCRKKLPFWKPKEGENIIEIIPNEDIEKMTEEAFEKVKEAALNDEAEKERAALGVKISERASSALGKKREYVVPDEQGRLRAFDTIEKAQAYKVQRDRKIADSFTKEKKEKPKSNGGLKRFLDF